MAKGDVTLRFDANTAAFVQKTLEAKAALDATAKSARDAGQHVAKAGEHWEKFGEKASDAFKEIGKHAAGVVGIPLSLASALEVATKTIENMMEKTIRKADELAAKTITLDAALAKFGKMGSAPQVTRTLAEMSEKSYAGRHFDDDVVVRQFAQIYSQVGHKTSIAGGMAATEAALKAQAADMSPDDATRYGVGVANLARLMPGASMKEVEDLAFKAFANAPDALSDPKNLRFLSRANPKSRGVALGAIEAASQSDESARALTAIQKEIEQQPSRQELGSMSPIERRRYKAIQEAGGDYQAIFSEPDKYLSSSAAIDARALARGAANVRDPGTLEGAMATAVKNEGASGSLVRIGHNTKTIAGQNMERGALEAQVEAEIQRRAVAIFHREHPTLSNIPGIDIPVAHLSSGMSGRPNARDAAAVEVENELIRASREGNDLAREQLRAMKNFVGAPNPALNNGKEGQK